MSLPPILEFDSYGNNWDKYLEALYRTYLDEVVNAGITFEDLPLRVQFHPMTDGKGFGFWHLISEGKDENERTPDLRRCERIRWIPWVLRNVEGKEVVCWENKRKQSIHIVIWFRRENYAVILAKRKGYVLLKTAYIVKPHRAKIFEKEWQKSQSNG